MKKIACCLGIGLLLAACFEDETIHADYVDYGRGYDTTSTNPVWKYVSQYYYKFGKEIILDPDTSDYMFNFQSKNEVRIVPPRQDEAHLSEALQFLREMFLDGYSDHVKEKIFPYAVILGDSIINVSSEPYVKMDICTATSYVAFLVNDEMIGKTEEEKAELSKQWNITFLNYCFSKIGWTVPESFYLYSNEEYGLRENWWIPVAGATEDSEPAPLDVVWERGYPQGTWTWQFAEDWTAPNEYGYSVASSRASYLEQFIDFLFSTPQEVIDEAIANHEKLRHAHDVLDNALKEDFGIDYRLIGYTIKE